MRIEDLIISEDMSVLQAMQQLNEKGKKILFSNKKRTNLSVFYYFEFAYTLLYAV